GPAKFDREFPLEEFPVYVKEGAIIPLDVKRSYTGLGDETSEGYLTLLIYPDGKSEFTVHHPDKSGSTVINVSEETGKINISLDGKQVSHILQIHLDRKPQKVKLDNQLLRDSVDYSFDENLQKLIIKTKEYRSGNYTINK
ncbi:MAG TPA: hypothetical protein VKA38_05700, partial [Draconibacterium sp.]|nr:hypothetical protein [Draconibacterium sp.]